MIRQARRKELRDVTKSLQKMKKLKEFKEMNSYFETLKKEDLLLLQSDTHPDPKEKVKYNRHLANMRYVIGLETKREILSKK
jgi:hypothetical protein